MLLFGVLSPHTVGFQNWAKNGIGFMMSFIHSLEHVDKVKQSSSLDLHYNNAATAAPPTMVNH